MESSLLFLDISVKLSELFSLIIVVARQLFVKCTFSHQFGFESSVSFLKRRNHAVDLELCEFGSILSPRFRRQHLNVTSDS